MHDPHTFWPCAILLMDMNAFFASIEQIDYPEIRGCPIGVTDGLKGTCIITSSYEARRFGNPGQRIWLMAQGEDPEQINTSVAPPKGLGHSNVMLSDTKDPDLIRLYLLHMSEKFAVRLRHHNLVAQQFTIGLRNLHGWLGGKYRNSVPVSDGRLIYQPGLKMLVEHCRGEGVHQLQITALDHRPAAQQLDLFQKNNTDRQCLFRVMDDINQRYGEFTLSPARLLNRSDCLTSSPRPGNQTVPGKVFR